MATDWEIKDKIKRAEMLETQKFVVLILKASYISGIPYVAFYFVKEALVNMGLPREERKLCVSSEFYFDTQSFPIYEIVWVCQGFVGGLFDFFIIVYDGLFIAVLLHLCTQLKILKMDIKSLTMTPGDSTFNNSIKSIVQRHLELMRCNSKNFHLNYQIKLYLFFFLSFSSYVEKIFNEPFLVQYFCFTLVLCVQGFQFILVSIYFSV